MRAKFAKILVTLSVVFGIFSLQLAPALAQGGAIDNGLCAGADLQFTENPGACNGTGGNASDKLNKLIHTVINLLSVIVGIVAVIMIIVGGFRYITSGGSDTGVTGAKNTILYAIIGLIIVALAQIMVRFVLAKVTNS